MAPHPFRETHPSLLPSGRDCSRIPNAKAVACVSERCVVKRCKVGWVANPSQGTCVRDVEGSFRLQKDKKRVLEASASAKASVDSGLVQKLSALVTAVVDINGYAQPANWPSFASPYALPSDSSAIRLSNLINTVSTGIVDLISSSSVSSFDVNFKSLSYANTLLRNTLAECGCVKRLALEPLVTAVETMATVTLDTQNYLASHPFVSINNGTVIDLDLPVAVGAASDVLSGLNLKETNSASFRDYVGNPINALLDGSNLEPRSHKRDNPALEVDADVVLDSGLVAQLKALIVLVAELNHANVLLPPPGSPVPHVQTVASNVVQAVDEATVELLASSTILSFVSNVNNLMSVNAVVLNTLHGCDCVEDLNLHQVLSSLLKVSEATLGLQSWCDRHPVAHHVSGSGSLSSIIPNTSNAPITLGLSHLLSGLVSANVKESTNTGVALLSGVSNALNDLLGSPIFRRGGVGRRGLDSATYNASVTATVNSDFAIKLSGLVDQVVELEAASSTLQHSLSPSSPSYLKSSIHTSLVAIIVNATVNLLDEPAVLSIVSNVDSLVEIILHVSIALDKCSCSEDLGLGSLVAHLKLVTDSVLDLQLWCRSHSDASLPGVSDALSALAQVYLPKLLNASITLGLPLRLSSGIDVSIAGLENGLGKAVGDLLGDLKGFLKPGGGSAGVDLDLSATLDALARSNINSQVGTQINTLINLVIDLNISATSLPAAISENIHGLSVPLEDVVGRILNIAVPFKEAPTFSLDLSVDDLINFTASLKSTLEECKCIEELGLGQFVEKLDKVTNAALDIQSTCRANSQLPTGSTHAPLISHTLNSELPTAFGLSNFHVGVDLEGGVVGLGADELSDG
jgi:hypothetical protein